ncbi:MAG: response regulator [Candidatus Schekmanbacteria bacterium]|nr:response regulator [Candidatus Schekmanbacteria bacterium]
MRLSSKIAGFLLLVLAVTRSIGRKRRGQRRAKPVSFPLSPKLQDLPVMVVEQNPADQIVLAKLLTKLGMKPTFAKTGAEAVAILERENNKFPLFILDTRTPQADNQAIIRRIKPEAESRKTKILLLTDNSPEEMPTKEDENSWGLIKHLHKPLNQAELFQAIMWIFDESSLKNIQTPCLPAAAMQKLSILLVEDSFVNQKLILNLLTRYEHEVISANNGQEALLKLQRYRIDLILMAVHMPLMDGFDLTAIIREQEKKHGGHIPIIALTADDCPEDQGRCLQAGMDDYLSKPIRLEELWEKIENLISRQKEVLPEEDIEGNI